MSKAEEDRFREVREELNQGVWDLSSDELRKLQTDRYARGEYDGADLPESVRQTVKTGSIFGKLIGVALLFGFGYLAYKFGGALSAFVRSFF